MIIIFTPAYNSGKLLHRAVESVMAQSCEDWVYYILDNGSTDNTSKIIQDYAARDRRIIPLKNNENKRLQLVHLLPAFLDQHKGEGLFYSIDADDEYAPDFFQKMSAFISENNLDVATCGTDWINEATGEVVKRKVPDRNLILEGYDFAEQFPDYRNFMVTVWGAVYSLELLRKCNFEWARNSMNFSDTAFCMEAFRRAERAGVFAECLHRYYIFPKTASYKFNPEWFRACKYLHKISREYLGDYGEISKQNEEYLYVLFLILIKYILPRIENADVELTEKFKCLNEIFRDETTQYMLRHWTEVGIYSDKDQFLREIEDWIKKQEGWEKERSAAERIIAAMNI